MTVISDGEPALPNLVRAAAGEPVRHIEQALAAIFALRPAHQAGLGYISVAVERLRHLIWNGYAAEAGALSHLASEAVYLNGQHFEKLTCGAIGRPLRPITDSA